MSVFWRLRGSLSPVPQFSPLYFKSRFRRGRPRDAQTHTHTDTYVPLSFCSTNPSQNPHSPSADLIKYATTAGSATSNTPAKQVAGGIAASIPLANALVPPAAPAASNAPPSATASRQTASQQQSTLTVTRASTNVATATVTGRPSLVGGGTSTATATTVVVVGPSGVAAATASGGAGSRAGVGGKNDTGAASPTGGQPVEAVPLTFTGAAGSRASASGALSLLMGLGAAALGSSLLARR